MTLVYRYKRNVDGVLYDKSNTKSLREMVEGEERRWMQADHDQDESLNIVEFQVKSLLCIRRKSQISVISTP